MVMYASSWATRCSSVGLGAGLAATGAGAGLCARAGLTASSRHERQPMATMNRAEGDLDIGVELEKNVRGGGGIGAGLGG